MIYDWGGGLIWAALPPKPDARPRWCARASMPSAATPRCCAPPSDVRRNVDVFHPQQAGLAALGERVRHSFDPKNILNRGRMMRGAAT